MSSRSKRRNRKRTTALLGSELNGAFKWMYYSCYHPLPGFNVHSMLRDYHAGLSLQEVEAQIVAGTYVEIHDPMLEMFHFLPKEK